MSNISSASSGGSGVRWRGRVRGIPKGCWCGKPVVQLVSKTNQNPYRRFFRCAYAAEGKLEDDNHLFKWIDEALINEVESGDLRAKRVEEEVTFIKKTLTESGEIEKKMFEKLEFEVEERLIERMETAISDAKVRMWKTMCLVIVIGGFSLVGITFVLG